jgi:hypothetical protein
MNRTAYFRQYYWRTVETRRASARASRRKARERAAIIKIVCEAVTEARNDNPPYRGLDAGGGMALLSGCMSRCRDDRPGEEVCQPPASHLGNSGRETNAQGTLNPHRGSQLVDTRRQSGSVNGNGETREK